MVFDRSNVTDELDSLYNSVTGKQQQEPSSKVLHEISIILSVMNSYVRKILISSRFNLFFLGFNSENYNTRKLHFKLACKQVSFKMVIDLKLT